MYKSKIFNGYFGCGEKRADDQFNEWMADHPNIEIKQFDYRHSRGGGHSICILYDDGNGISKKRIANEETDKIIEGLAQYEEGVMQHYDMS